MGMVAGLSRYAIVQCCLYDLCLGEHPMTHLLDIKRKERYRVCSDVEPVDPGTVHLPRSRCFRYLIMSEHPGTMGDTTRCLSILHFNDVYNVDVSTSQEPVGGASRFVYAVQKQQKEMQQQTGVAPLVLFSGDCFSPSLMSVSTLGKQMVPVMNSLGITAACVGKCCKYCAEAVAVPPPPLEHGQCCMKRLRRSIDEHGLCCT